MILQHSERHLAYPVLHFFHSTLSKYSAPLTFTILDEAISIQKILEIDKSPNAINWQVLRETLDSFIDVQEKFNTSEKITEPPFYYLDQIPDLPVNQNYEEIKKSAAGLAERRKLLHGIIKRDGWNWEDVVRRE